MIQFETSEQLSEKGEAIPKSLSLIRIKILGVGGAGCSTVSRICSRSQGHSSFAVCDSSTKTLAKCENVEKLTLGISVTRGWGTGGDKEIAKKIAEDAENEIRGILDKVDLLFLICSLGKGVGAGASPVILKIAKEMGIVSIGFFILPFNFEGKESVISSEEALSNLWQLVDAAVIVSNDILLHTEKATLTNSSIPFGEIFTKVDQVFETLLQSIENSLFKKGVVDLDFADLKSFLVKGKQLIITTGEGSGQRCIEEAIERMLYSPFWGEVSLDKAKGILLCIQAGKNLKLNQLEKIILSLRQRTVGSVPITFGVYPEEDLSDKLILTLMISQPQTLELKRRGQEKVQQQELGLGGYNTNDLDVPTFLRKRHN